jgi:hypothetical protein
MGDYGFGDEPPKKVKLKSARKPVTTERLSKAAEVGQDLGFVSREPISYARVSKPKPRRVGRRQTEPQDKFLVTGPKRILDEFKIQCDKAGGVTYWQMIEILMLNYNDHDKSSSR